METTNYTPSKSSLFNKNYKIHKIFSPKETESQKTQSTVYQKLNKINYKLSISKSNKNLNHITYYTPKMNSSNNLRINFHKEEVNNQIRKDISLKLFKNNDVELVRNLNSDLSNELFNNQTLREYLKKNLDNNYKFIIKSPQTKTDQKSSLPKIQKRLTINGILENDKQIKEDKNETNKIKKSNLIETELLSQLNKVKNDHKSKKEEQKQLYENYQNIMKEIDGINLELELLNTNNNNNNNDNNNNKKYSKRKSHLFDDNKKKERPSVASLIPFMGNIENNNINEQNEEKMKDVNYIKFLIEQQKEKDIKKKKNLTKLNILKQDLANITKRLNLLNEELEEENKKEKQIKQKLMEHYQELLYKGKEIRNEGLIWIIKAIWKLDENVPLPFMPNFLDFESIEYLFNLAHMSTELENFKKYLKSQKLQLKNQVDIALVNNNQQSFRNSIFKTNLKHKKISFRRSISQPAFIKNYIRKNKGAKNFNNEYSDNNVNFREMCKILENSKNNVNILELPAIHDIDNIQNKIKELELKITNYKKEEVKRIFKEFIDNDYEKKYYTNIETVLGALIGEHSKNIEVNRFYRFKKEYFDEIRNIRFYEGKRNPCMKV